MKSIKENRLGFKFDGFELYDGFDDTGYCYFNEAGCSFYTCATETAEYWWNEESMDITLKCPFCEGVSVGGFHDKDRPFVKHWMGKHLALFHPTQVEQFHLRREAQEEYGWYGG